MRLKTFSAAKVAENDSQVSGQEEILRFDVAVADVSLVQVRHRLVYCNICIDKIT